MSEMGRKVTINSSSTFSRWQYQVAYVAGHQWQGLLITMGQPTAAPQSLHEVEALKPAIDEQAAQDIFIVQGGWVKAFQLLPAAL